MKQSHRVFQQNHPQTPLTSVAYFSMEFMLSEALPIYSAGLACGRRSTQNRKRSGVPWSAWAPLPARLFRQVIDKDGAQQPLPVQRPGQLPITPLREPNGSGCARDQVARLLGLAARWQSSWPVKLYLLDSNDPANFQLVEDYKRALRGGPELRLNQELALGIGGWRLLNALGSSQKCAT